MRHMIMLMEVVPMRHVIMLVVMALVMAAIMLATGMPAFAGGYTICIQNELARLLSSGGYIGHFITSSRTL